MQIVKHPDDDPIGPIFWRFSHTWGRYIWLRLQEKWTSKGTAVFKYTLPSRCGMHLRVDLFDVQYFLLFDITTESII